MQFSSLILALAASTSLSLAQPIAMEHVESIIEVPSSSTPSVLEAREPLFGFGKSKPPKIDYQLAECKREHPTFAQNLGACYTQQSTCAIHCRANMPS